MLNSLTPEFTIGLFGFVFVEGLVSFLSPCILPMLPVYLLYFASDASDIALKEARRTKVSRRLITNTIAFILGFTLIFALLGATASSIGLLLNAHRLLVQRLSGIIMIVFGLQYIGAFRFAFLNKEARFHINTSSLTFMRSMLFGMVFSFGWTPCLGPFLGSALMFAARADTVWQGIALLCTFGFGLGIPFLLTALISDMIKPLLNFFKRHHKVLRLVSGITLIIIGLCMAFDIIGYYQGLFS